MVLCPDGDAMDRLVDGRAEYDAMLITTEYWHCWWCGRYQEDIPDDWYAPWLIERAHVAALPRVLDRRLVVLLCSLCHRTQHGQLFEQSLKISPPTQATMLWLKSTFDPQFYNRAFVQRFHMCKLPKPHMPPADVQQIYTDRRGEYPIKE
jgi:hypothetical protein